MLEGFLSAAGTLLMVAVILLLCYFTTRKLGKMELGKGTGQYIRLLDKTVLGQDKSIALVKAGGKYLLLGIAASHISVLAELEESQVEDTKVQEAPGGAYNEMNFKSVMEMLKDRKIQK